MKISIKQSTIVKPASKTPSHVVWCSNMDLIAPPIHIPILYWYSNHALNPTAFSFQHLRESLGRALVPYYPVAGRLRQSSQSGRIEIDCNAEGVLFVEAVAEEVSLSDFGEDFAPNPNMKFFIPQLDYSQQMSAQPILVIQVTRLKCGGICVGVGFHHIVVDGPSALQFLNFWGDIAKSALINGSELIRIQPVFDRIMLMSRDPPMPKFEHLEYLRDLSSLQQEYDKTCRNATPEVTTNINQNLNYDNDKNRDDDDYDYNNINKLKNVQLKEDSNVITDVFSFTQDQISALKKKAAAETMDSRVTTARFTTVEVVSAHVWRCVSLARALHHSQLTNLIIPTDGRTRLNPQLPEGYFGNVIFYAVAIKPVGDLVNSPIGEIIEFISKAIHRMDDEYLRSAIDYLQVHSESMLLQQNGEVTASSVLVGMVNWARLPGYDLDFGWGAPLHTGPPGELHFEGQCALLPTRPTSHYNQLTLNIALSPLAMVRFRELVYQI